MFFLKKLFICFLFLSPMSIANSIDRGVMGLLAGLDKVESYPKVVKILIDNDLYYTSVPYLKEYLVLGKGKTSAYIDVLLETVLSKVGIKQFEVLPEEILEKSLAPTIKFVLAKKYFRKKMYQKAQMTIRGSIDRGHSLKPFALNLEGAISSILGDSKEAIEFFNECSELSSKKLGQTKDQRLYRQLEVNRDYCIIGRARTYFSDKQHDKANLEYLDLEKSSPIWPEILFEEAWNSFYQGNYNRTLGKLVTYKAPVLGFIFNPEIEILKALSYMELCLWDDVKIVVDQFYSEFGSDYKSLEKLLESYRDNYIEYYKLAKTKIKGQHVKNVLLDRILNQITRDPTFKEIYTTFVGAKQEIDHLSKIADPRLRSIFGRNLKDSLYLQRNIIGSYIKGQIGQYYREIHSTFSHMSYIKLEVLSRKKTKLYSPVEEGVRSRGDFRYLKRNDKQFFWSFNGEFWADELGDYVFALKSEC